MEVRPGGRLLVTNVPLRIMVRNIFRLQDFQVVGGPDWIDRDRWDIVASTGTDVTEPEAAKLLERLLQDRFKLRTHVEKRDMPIYALVIARPDRGLGPQLVASTVDCAVARTCGDSTTPGMTRVVGRPISAVLRVFERLSGRSVVDRTGLTGQYDFTLRWRPDAAQDVNADFPSLFTAIEEQLGLKLQPERAAMDVLVIDAAERPVVD
jgi:uncharacterized protein (TIGR03435 family)